MAIMQWSDELSIGMPEIDHQHQTIINIINKIHSSYSENKNNETMNKLLPELKWYAEEHFKHEELLMLETDFPHYKEHKAIHQEMLEKVNNLIQVYSKNEIPDGNETLNFFVNWLTGHIKVDDLKLGKHANIAAAQ